MEESLTPDRQAQFWGGGRMAAPFFNRLVFAFAVPGKLCYAEVPRDRQP
jgi:hypothetical protein